jgi:hypothetical protein
MVYSMYPEALPEPASAEGLRWGTGHTQIVDPLDRPGPPTHTVCVTDKRGRPCYSGMHSTRPLMLLQTTPGRTDSRV